MAKKKGKNKADKKEVAKEDEPGFAENEEWVETLGKTLGGKIYILALFVKPPYYRIANPPSQYYI